jgi:hypothetical protein
MPAKTNKPLKYVFIEKTVIEGWAKNYEPVMVYLSKLHNRQGAAGMALYLFCDWAGVNPNDCYLISGQDSAL